MSLIAHQRVFGGGDIEYSYQKATVIRSRPSKIVKSSLKTDTTCSPTSKKHPDLWMADAAEFVKFYAPDYRKNRNGLTYLGNNLRRAEFKVKAEHNLSSLQFDLARNIIVNFVSQYCKFGYKASKKYVLDKFTPTTFRFVTGREYSDEECRDMVMTAVVYGCRFINVVETNDKSIEIQLIDPTLALHCGSDIVAQSFIAKVSTNDIRGLIVATQTAIRYVLAADHYISQIILIVINIQSKKIMSYKINPWYYVNNMVSHTLPPNLGVVPVNQDEYNRGLEDARNKRIGEGSEDYNRGVKFHKDFESNYFKNYSYF